MLALSCPSRCCLLQLTPVDFNCPISGVSRSTCLKILGVTIAARVELSLLNCCTLPVPGGDLLPPMINSVQHQGFCAPDFANFSDIIDHADDSKPAVIVTCITRNLVIYSLHLWYFISNVERFTQCVFKCLYVL